jgi:hypothetical protein
VAAEEGRVSSSAVDKRWRLRRTESGLRLGQLRAFGTERFTWADLLRAPLAATEVYVLYFPSRFALPVDGAVTEALQVFGSATSQRTSVDFWDPQDEHFSDALALFGLEVPPALVLATGLQTQQSDPAAQAAPAEPLYCISFVDQTMLSERAKLAAAVNAAHEVLMRCDRNEIAGYIRSRKVKSLLEAIGKLSAALRDQLLKLKPKFGLPGGFSIELG